MADVRLTEQAQADLEELPITIHARVLTLFDRLEKWPEVSGAKPTRGNLAGFFRLRTGDYRLIFRVTGETVIVQRIGHRDGFYE
ncbi:MAG: type II toxin-antitoxin system RelE/ParE family toxin [Planctomycetales bacterium]|nr:type II toxin-antitoxin system RelE/ParE family toxin [Planctomycetales bacterium]